MWCMFSTSTQVMFLYQQDDALLCKVFPASLEDGTIAWLQQLTYGIVISITDQLIRIA